MNLPAAGFNSALGISLGNILGSFNLDAALTALERQGRGRLLSTPKVTTQNNQEAEIKQGVQIPIQTVANNTVTVSFKDAVLTLKVTPQITEAGTVILNVEVENNSADFANLRQRHPAHQHPVGEDPGAGAGRRHRGHRRHLPEQRADVADAHAVPGHACRSWATCSATGS